MNNFALGDQPPRFSVADISVLDRLERRPSRAEDFEAENLMLGVLADELAGRPDNLLQKLTDILVEKNIGDSVGISLRETAIGDTEQDGDRFRWVALSGAAAGLKGTTLPFDASPCGVVVRHDAVLMLDHPELHFPNAVTDPHIHELLLVPFHSGGKPVGTLWVAMHSAARTFEAEDIRLVKSLARFAAASYQLAELLRDARADEQASKAALAADLAGLHRLHEVYAKLAVETDVEAAFRVILAAAVDLTDTDRGVLQLVSEDGERLEFAVHHGYGEGTAFTEHFRYEGAKVACDSARQHHQRMIIEDTATFPGLMGTIDQRIVLAEDIRATQSTPMVSRTGQLIGVLNTQFRIPHRPSDRELRLVDMLAWAAAAFVDRHSAADAALRASEARFRELGKASSDVIWIRSAETQKMEYLNPAFVTTYGAPCEPYAGTGVSDWLSLIHVDDRAAFAANLDRLRGGERVRHEFRIVRPADGAVRWISNTDFPLTDDKGQITRIGGIGHDVTEEKANAARLAVLVGELQHRTRNVLAVVRSLADTTMRGADTIGQFSEAYRVRLDALGRVQGLLSRLDTGDRAAFDELVRIELFAIGAVDADGHGPKVTLDGPGGVRLRSSTVQTLALALHELATNAAKYGALAQPQGRLLVRWRVEPAQTHGESRLVVEWHESGVLMPADGAAPRGSGFGRELIERALPYQLDAETTYLLGSDGVHCTVNLPLADLLAVENMAHD